MAWFEVKKINKNFLKETLDSKIKTIGSKLFSSIKSIIDTISLYNSNIASSKTAVWHKQIVYSGLSDRIQLTINGKGSVEIYLIITPVGVNSWLTSYTRVWKLANAQNIDQWHYVNVDGVYPSDDSSTSIALPIKFNNYVSLNIPTDIAAAGVGIGNIKSGVIGKNLPYIVVVTLEE